MKCKNRILVVEDEPLTAMDFQCSLERLGYEVLPTAASASAALDLAVAHQPDVVLMDIHLEGAADGIDAAAAINARVNIPVIFLTAFADEETIRRALQIGPCGYLLKPVRSEELRVAIDVALHKHQLEQQLRERERWFATTLHSIADAVITVDTQNVVTFMNSAAEFMTGVPEEQGVGRPIREVLQLVPPLDFRGDPEPQLTDETPLERTMREGRVVDMREGRLKNLSNGEILVIADSAAQVIADGQVLGAVMVFHDITEQKQMHETLLISDRMASIGLLAAGVAHEINSPLAVVMANDASVATYLGETACSTPSDAKRTEQLSLLQDSCAAAQRIRDVVRDLMQFARSEGTERQTVDLWRVMDSSLRLAHNATQARARIEKHYEAVPPVLDSESRLGQVFLNMLVNAAQAMSDGPADEHVIRVSLRTNDDGDAVVEIADTGAGMSELTLKRLFTPFFTTKPIGSGTGLGLSICRRIVTSLGGTIHVESQLGKGTLVRIVLPKSKPETASTPPPAPIKPEGRRARILVIDDEPMVARVLQRSLVLHHDVEVFHSAELALARILEGQRYDIIVCDLMMPQMNGMDLQSQLAQCSPEQARRMVFVSGGGFSPRARAFLETSKTPVLDKPIDLTALEALVNQHAPQ